LTRGPIDRRPPVETALVIHPARSSEVDRSPQSKLEEAAGLALALDLDVRESLIAPLRQVTPATLFGKGKTEEIRHLVAELGVSVAVVDDALTPVQQRNLEKAWNVKVIDRTGLILEIFARRARTREGRLQVELARLDYERSRLVRTWTHLERQRGGFGVMGGPGETQIETDRRLIAEKIIKLKRELDDVRRTRGLHRKSRERTPFPTIALVGYTNAGKSTLFNRLTQSTVVAKDMLFATLDPTLREIKLPGGRPAILSDTVGFISDLPHELVEAFRATLEEVQQADLILHVRDIAGEDSDAQAADVEEVLDQIGCGKESARVLIEVWNKVDLVAAEDKDPILNRAARNGASAISAVTGEGIEALLTLIASRVDEDAAILAVISPDQGEALAWLYRNGRVASREDGEDGTTVAVRLDRQALGRFERRFPEVELRAG
jgi:GTP-binding protein HflX